MYFLLKNGDIPGLAMLVDPKGYWPASLSEDRNLDRGSFLKNSLMAKD